MKNLNMKIKLLIILSLVLLLFTGCNNEEVEPNPGHMDENTYINDFLGFSIELPKDWEIQTDENMEKINDIGKEVVAGDDENAKNALEALESSTLFSIGVFKHPLGTPGELNPNIMVMAEDIELYEGIKTNKDYLENLKNQFDSTEMNMNIGEIDEVEFDGIEFDKLSVSTDAFGVEIYQEYYVTIINRHALSIIVTYFDDETHKEISDILQTIKSN